MRYVPTHGSRGKYLRGCRCEPCTEANREYHRRRAAGAPNMGWPKLAPEVRFWAKVQKSDGCWVWTGSRDRRGYGRFRVRYGDPPVLASRMAWEMTHGPIPDGMYVCHRCDNPPCVRPDHLFVGTASDNMQDMARKDRASKHGRLSDDDVAAILARVSAGERQSDIARSLGITQPMVSMIANGQRKKRAAVRRIEEAMG